MPVRACRTIACLAVAAALAGCTTGHRDVTPSTPPAIRTSPAPAVTRLSALLPAERSERVLLRSTGSGDASWTLTKPGAGRSDLYAVCLGGGSIFVDMPGSGGFVVLCTGAPSGAALPATHRQVRIMAAAKQRWRVAVFQPASASKK